MFYFSTNLQKRTKISIKYLIVFCIALVLLNLYNNLKDALMQSGQWQSECYNCSNLMSKAMINSKMLYY